MSHHESQRLDPEQLSGELRWLRALARQLVHDPEAADDLVQDAVVVAIERGGGSRSWMAGVLRNLSLRKNRSEGRRKFRERRGARSESIDDPNELSAELQAQADLVRAVLALDEPYRHTIQRRFYRGRSPRAIAAEDGVSVNTVNSRLQRGLARLRERMDAVHGGDRSAWCIALLPLVEQSFAPAVPIVGALTVKTALIATSVLVATAVAVLVPNDPETPVEDAFAGPSAAAPATEVDEVATADAPGGADAATAPSMEQATRRTVAAAPPAPSETEVEPVVLVPVRGRVVDVEGRLVPSVLLVAEGGGRGGEGAETRTFAGNDGAFELRLSAEDSVEIRVDERDLVTVQRGAWTDGRNAEPVVVVAEARTIAGRVLGPEGDPVEGARVILEGPADLTSRIGLELDASTQVFWQVTTDATGGFRIDDGPAFADGLLDVSHPDYASQLVPIPQRDADRLEIVLRAPTLLGPLALRGQVIDATGQPVDGAFVRTGSAVVTCDDRGLFELDPVRALDTAELVALAPGSLPGRLVRPTEPTDDDSGWPDFVTLVLGGPTLAIDGRLVDTDGEPVAGARVWAGNAEAFGAIGAYPLTLEGLAAGQSLPGDAIAQQRDMPTASGDERFGWFSWRGQSDAMWAFETTDAEGRFQLGGLLDRDYELGILLSSPLVSTTTGPVAAGASGIDVTIEVPAALERVRGRVVDELGEPLAGIQVQPYEVALSPERQVLGGTTQMNLIYSLDSAISDASGAFELEGVPVDGMLLWMLGEGILPTPSHVRGPIEAEGLVLELPCRRRLQVELLDADQADAFEVRDANGVGLPLYEMQVGQVKSFPRGLLAEGRSAVVSVGLAARTLVLLDGDEAVVELPLELSATDVTYVQY